MRTTGQVGFRCVVVNEQPAHGLRVDAGMELLPEVVVAEALRYIS